MIGLFALVIAFLTLLSPSPEGQGSFEDRSDWMSAAAILADETDGLDVLLGRWRVRIAPAAGASDEATAREDIELKIVRHGTGAPHVHFGPPEEQWTGEVSLSRASEGPEFASRTTCETLAHGESTELAHLTGRLVQGRSGDQLRGTLFLESDEELVTWTAVRERVGTAPALAR